jgi:hypothetical protein
MKYEVIESRAWRHTDGRTASIYGACPWVRLEDAPGWEVVSRGWTVRNPYTGQVGVCRQPWPTREEAEAWAAAHTPSRISDMGIRRWPRKFSTQAALRLGATMPEAMGAAD